jgi:homoserine dehydrogenase
VARVALLGFGTVGSAVARRLTAPDHPANIVLTHVFDRRADVKRRAWPPSAPIVWTDRLSDVLESDADIVVEAIGGVEPAADFIHGALAAGKSVVTANKQVVARHGASLWALAARQGRQLRFEAAVGGAMPIVRAVGEGLAGDRIVRIRAILNGTTNAVLSTMDATGCSLADAIAHAKASGWAERDPRADLDGDDARAKLAILCALAFGVRVAPDSIPMRSTSEIGALDLAAARRLGETIRQIAHAEWDRVGRVLTAWVAPVCVARDSIFGRTIGPRNAAIVTGQYSGDTTISGVGAGGDATAVAILSDVLAIAKDRAAIVPPPALISDFRVQSADLGCALRVDRCELVMEAV